MPIYDVSVPLSASTPTYPGDPGIEVSRWLELAHGDPANVSFIKFGAHSGTHVDAPAHFIEGAARVESLSLDVLIGKARVIAVPPKALVIDRDFVARNLTSDDTRILFKTRNSEFWSTSDSKFQSDYTYIDPAAATLLVERGVRLVGIDYLSVEQFQSPHFETHHVLLGNGVVIIEGLDLRGIDAGTYELICLPLRVSGGDGDGAPARVVLRTTD